MPISIPKINLLYQMKEIDELILFENESKTLDFKIIEYRQENHSSLLKDVISMSNANTQDNRYILIGLKPKSINDRGIVGIKGELTDSANIQQLIFENIEPEINLEYFPHKYKEFTIGVLKISNCDNPPYLMKKDFGNGKNKLYKGDGFIRIGSHQPRLTRKDYDRFTELKNNQKYFSDDVEFILTTNDLINEIKLKSLNNIQIPSQINKEKIERILKEKKEKAKNFEKLGIVGQNFINNINLTPSFFGGTTYEQRDILTLENNLKNIEQTYEQHDYYEIFEKQANKYNISIYNKGFNYIEDASIILKVPKLKGLFISDRIYTDPENNHISSMSSFNYPIVKEQDDFYIIENSIGNLKHQIKQNAFDTDLRIFANTELKNKEFKIVCELFAKNIKVSIKKEILIKTK